MQYLHNVKLSTRDKEEYTGHENIWDWWNPVWLPGLSFAQIIPLLWCFYHFWSSFIEVKVLNELHSTTVSSQKQNIIFPEMKSETSLSHSPLFLGCEHFLLQHTKTIYNTIFYSSHVLHLLHCLQQFNENKSNSL